MFCILCKLLNVFSKVTAIWKPSYDTWAYTIILWFAHVKISPQSPPTSLFSHIPTSASVTHLNTVCYSCMWETLFTISTVWWRTWNNWNLLFLLNSTLVLFSIMPPHKGCSNHPCMSWVICISWLFLSWFAHYTVYRYTCCIGIFVWQPLVCDTQLLMSLNASS